MFSVSYAKSLSRDSYIKHRKLNRRVLAMQFSGESLDCKKRVRIHNCELWRTKEINRQIGRRTVTVTVSQYALRCTCFLKNKNSHRQLGPLRGSSYHFSPLSWRRLHPLKPVYDPDRPDGRLNLTASAFNQLGQYTSTPGRRGYCYAYLAVFLPSGDGGTIAS